MKSWDVCLLLGSFLLVVGVRGVERCPPKRCVLLESCPMLAARIRGRGLAGRSSVRDAVCGYKGLRAKVCCPADDLVDVEMMPPSRVHKKQETVPVRRTTSIHKVTVSTEETLPELEVLQCGRGGISSRIFEGNLTSLGSYPWLVAMRYEHETEKSRPEKVLCAGSLINSRYVVTAAHCLDPSRTKGWKLKSLALGDWRLSTDPDCDYAVCAPKAVVALVERTIIPAEYNSTTLDHDIALLRLDRTVNFSHSIRPICLPPRMFAPGEVSLGSTVVATGWGMTETFQNSDVLMEANLPIVHPYICKKKFPSYFHFNAKQMCVGGGRADTCLGDSGGPLMKLNSAKQFYLLAVTSFGHISCGTEGNPAVYTSVAHFSDWIRASIKP